MNRAFVDTTIITDCLLKTGDEQLNAKNALVKYEITELPEYAIKEFQAGPLSYYCWAHNSLLITGSIEGVYTKLNGIARGQKKYLIATALEAFGKAAHDFGHNHDFVELAEKYGRGNISKIQADQYRYTLKRLIYNSWKKKDIVVTSVVYPLPCFVKKGIVEDRQGLLRVSTVGCEKERECSIAPEMRKRINDLKKLVKAISDYDINNPKRENQRRSKALNHLIKKPKVIFDRDLCRSLGDAYFALFAPSDATILTTNVADHEPLAVALGKRVEGT